MKGRKAFAFIGRFLVGILAVLILVLLLVQTPPLESLLLKRLVREAAVLGFDLKVAKLDVYPFQLALNFKGLELKGEGLEVTLDRLYVNANHKIGLENIVLDSILVGQGRVKIGPALFTPAEKAAPTPNPMAFPRIDIGQARIQAVSLDYMDRKADLTFGLSSFKLNYEISVMTAAFVTAPTVLEGRPVPSLDWSLSTVTTNFKEFDDIICEVESSQSHAHVMGSAGIERPPHLDIQVDLGGDLLPELPGLALRASLHDRQAGMGISYRTEVAGQPITVEISSDFATDAQPLLVPLMIKTGDLASGRLDLAYEAGNLSGIIEMVAEPGASSRFMSNLDLHQVGLKGKFNMPGLNVDALTANAELVAQGTQNARIDAVWERGAGRLSGEASPFGGAQFNFSGVYQDGLRLDFEGAIAGLEALSDLAPLPSELCSGEMVVAGRLVTDFKQVSLDYLYLYTDQLAYLPHFEGDFCLQAEGPFSDLRGVIQSRELNPAQTAISFALDLNREEWLELDIDLESTSLRFQDKILNLDFQGTGQGPLTAPNIVGNLTAQLYNGGQLASLETSLALIDERLDLSQLSLRTAHGRVRGRAEVGLSDSQWQLDLVVETAADGQFDPLFALDLPFTIVELHGDQSQLRARVSLADQTFHFEDADIPLSSKAPMEIQGNPGEATLNGSYEQLEIAGLRLADLRFQIQDQVLRANVEFDLSNQIMLSRVLDGRIPEGLILDQIHGSFALESPLTFEKPRFDLNLEQLCGTYQGHPFDIADLEASFYERLHLKPFTMNFVGFEIELASVEPGEPSQLPTGPVASKADLPPIAIGAFFELRDQDALQQFLGADWPEGLHLDELRGYLEAMSDLNFNEPQIGFQIDVAKGLHGEVPFISENAGGGYGPIFWLAPFELTYGNLTTSVTEQPGGFRVHSSPDVTDLRVFMPELVGDAAFDLTLNYLYGPVGGDPTINASIRQTTGNLIYPSPWMSISNTELDFENITEDRFTIARGVAQLNNGEATLTGDFDFSGSTPVVKVNVGIIDAEMEVVAFQANLTSFLEWRIEGQENLLSGSITVNDGYYNQDIELRGLVEDLLSEVPELYFPDPFLEQIKLQIYVQTPEPVVIDTNLGFWELETPFLLITGNLGDPMPNSGPLYINEGSLIEQKNKTFIFLDSQIQFHPNRLGDPYLQLAIVEDRGQGEKRPVYLTGYMSELTNSLDTQGLTSFLLNFLLSNVSSLVSFEIEINDTILGSSFTSIVSKTLTPRTVVRYAIPLSDQQSQRRLELRGGPFYGNYLNIADEDNTQQLSFFRSQNFGYPDHHRPLRVRRIRFQPKELPSWLRKGFKIRNEDIYSEIAWNRAAYDLRKRCQERGYIQAKVDHKLEDGKLTVEVDLGPQVTMQINGLETTPRERGRLFRMMRAGRPINTRRLEMAIEQIAFSHNYPSAAAFATVTDDRVEAQVLLGFKVTEVNLNFGDADPILNKFFEDSSARQHFLADYLSSDQKSGGRLRALLAAEGYLLPEIEDGDFIDLHHFRIPIKPGPRADLKAVTLNGQPWRTPLVGNRFQYEYIGQVSRGIAKSQTGNSLIAISPRREGKDVVIEVTARTIEEPLIQSLEVDGTSRISAKTVKKFLGFDGEMKQGELVEAQKRLIQTGVYRQARFRQNEGSANLEVNERNRYEVNYEVSWAEEEDFGYAIQFKDRILLHGFNQMAVRAERNTSEERLLTQLKSLRPFGLPFDAVLELDWRNDLKDPEPSSPIPDFGDLVVPVSLSEDRIANFQLQFTLTQHQSLTSGVSWQRKIVHERRERYFDGDLTSQPTIDEDFTIASTLIPITSSWLFQNLDNEINPKKGVFSQITASYYPEELGSVSAFSGTRLLGKFSTFMTRGRWLWSQRYEAGWYNLQIKDASRPETIEDSPFFLLGGAKSIRGFRRNLIGPLDAEFPVPAEGSDEIPLPILKPRGGEAMFFFSQELNLDLRFYGIGLSPFVDGGWVWESQRDLFGSGLLVSGGLGVSVDTPVGKLRIDWAKPLVDEPFREVLDDLFFDQETADAVRRSALQQFTFRFGRVF